MQALRIIEREHRSLAAVLHGLLYLVREIRYGGDEPDFELLNAMVRYVDVFSERFHHPKEDAYLFERLGVRHSDAAALIDRLKREHESGAVRLRELQDKLKRYEETGPSALPEFAAQLAAFAAFHWGHMRLEEDSLIPLAKLHLTAADWHEIDAAFLGHSDPLFCVERGAEYEELFRRIVSLAPRPLGVAPARK